MGDGDREDRFEHDDLATDPGPAWRGVGASQGPRPPAEGVRIIGAEEAAAAIESGDVVPRRPDDAPRFGDVPEQPSGPRPPFRFPGDDPASVPKPPVAAAPEPDPSMPGQTMGHLGGGFNEELVAPRRAPAEAAGEPRATHASDHSHQAGVAANGGDSEAPAAAEPDGGGLFGAPLRGGSNPERLFSPRDREHTTSSLFESAVSREPAFRSRDGDPFARVGGRSWWESAGSSGGGGTSGMAEGSRPGNRFFDAPSDDRSFWREPTAMASQDDTGVRRDPVLDDSPAGDSGFERGASAPIERGASAPIERGASAPIERGAPAPVDDDPTVSYTGQRGRDDSGSVPLPHWTEPPSGEHPRILADGTDTGPGDSDELNAWSSLATGPRWRDQPADWDDSGFHEAIAEDADVNVGALSGGDSPAADSDLFSFDDAPEPRSRRARGSRQQAPPPYPGPMPSAYPGDTATAGPARSSGDVGTRVVTGLAIAGVALIAAVIGPGALLLVVTAAVVMATAELFQGLRSRGYQPATLLGLVGTASLMGAVYWRGETAFPLILSLYTVFCLLWYLIGVVRARPTMNVAVSLMAFMYVGFLGSFAALLLKFPLDHGIGLLLGAVIGTVAYDVGAFFVGRAFGKTPLAPSISPGKTFEGLVGATLITVAACLLVVSQIAPWNAGRAFWLAVVVAVAAPLGDLCESMIKRDLGVKDMGNILPGHGGVLDRIDALLFVVPATYYLVRLLDFF